MTGILYSTFLQSIKARETYPEEILRKED